MEVIFSCSFLALSIVNQILSLLSLYNGFSIIKFMTFISTDILLYIMNRYFLSDLQKAVYLNKQRIYSYINDILDLNNELNFEEGFVQNVRNIRIAHTEVSNIGDLSLLNPIGNFMKITKLECMLTSCFDNPIFTARNLDLDLSYIAMGI